MIGLNKKREKIKKVIGILKQNENHVPTVDLEASYHLCTDHNFVWLDQLYCKGAVTKSGKAYCCTFSPVKIGFT